ncbi:TPA: hypothetical protein DCL30_00615 [Candidatus Peribacteria bacterium]|nr:hypothetical protein [Candidatus Peribacteria bacterium]HAS34602.1 hypothetical protein [Candidatus Peribacteria bacterium]
MWCGPSWPKRCSQRRQVNPLRGRPQRLPRNPRRKSRRPSPCSPRPTRSHRLRRLPLQGQQSSSHRQLPHRKWGHWA